MNAFTDKETADALPLPWRVSTAPARKSGRPSKLNQCPTNTPEHHEETLRLWALAGQGDAEAFNDIVDHWGGFVVGVANQTLKNWHDAEDAAQGVWEQLWRRKPEIKGKPHAFFFVCARFGATLVRNRIFLKRRGGPKIEEQNEETRREIYNLHAHKRGGVSIDGTENVPEEDRGFRHLGMIRRLVAGLKPEYRELIEARFYRGEMPAAVGARMGMTAKRVAGVTTEIVRGLRRRVAHEVGWESVGKFCNEEERERLRSHGGFRRRGETRTTPIDWPRIIALAESGMPAMEIAERTGVKYDSVRTGLRRHRIRRDAERIAA